MAASEPPPRSRRKVIIDSDPGVDDALALLMALERDDVEVLGVTTIFGNVRTPLATDNALRLLELAGYPHIPVHQGSCRPLAGWTLERVADFVHGGDGLGNTDPAPPLGKPGEASAAQFIVDMAHKYPGEISVLALAPLTNIALALHLDPDLPERLQEIAVLGGAFFVNGNVNPAAEANMVGDPEAADMVFGCSANIRVVGLDVTRECILLDKELQEIQASNGDYASYIYELTQFYKEYHIKAYNLPGIFLHDPTALAAMLQPELFHWSTGAVRVITDGIAKGMTIMDSGGKIWYGENPWTNRPALKVAVKADSKAVVDLVKNAFIRSKNEERRLRSRSMSRSKLAKEVAAVKI